MSGRHVPWASWREWEAVRDHLFSEDVAVVQEGLRKVTGWRRRGRLPLGVDITSALLTISLRDPLGLGPTLPVTVTTDLENSLQAEYSLAIIRFVNGVTDSCQKGKVATSVAKIADDAGLHPMLVDIRHEATHNQLPSLHMLRLAASHSISWLHSNYWAAQTEKTAAAASQALQVLERLILNQSARAGVAATSGNSSQPSDSDSPNTDDVEMSAAGLKKQQKALLGELKPIIPLSHPSDLAHVLLFRPSELPGASAAQLASLPESRQQQAFTNALSFLSQSYTDLLHHLLVQCCSILRDSKISLQNILASGGASSDNRLTEADWNSPCWLRVHLAGTWGFAAMQVSQSSSDTAAHQDRLAYVLEKLFNPAALFPAHHEPSHQSGRQTFMQSLQALYSCADKGIKPSRDAPVSMLKRIQAVLGSSEGDAAGKTEKADSSTQKTTPSEQVSALEAMFRMEDCLVKMCQKDGNKQTRAMAHLIGHLTSALCPTEACSEEPGQPKAPSSAAHGASTATAAEYATAVANESHSHEAALERIRSAPRGGAPAAAGARAGGSAAPAAEPAPSVGTKRTRADDAPAAAGAPPTSAPRPRFYVVEDWCSCPIGTLPSGLPGVGIIPRLYRDKSDGPRDGVEATAAAPERAAGAAGLGARGAEGHPGTQEAMEVDGDAAAAPGLAGAASSEQDGVARVIAEMEAAAERDAAAALENPGGFVWEEVEDEGEEAGGAADDDAGGAGGGGSTAGLLLISDCVRGIPKDLAGAEELRERILKACAAVLG